MKHYFLLYCITLVVTAVLDLSWIGGIASNFYKSRIPNLEFQIAPAIAFYLVYVGGIIIFVSGNPDATWQSTLLYGAMLGFLAYATYDLTNLATLRGWSFTLAFVDLAWGTLVTAVSSTLGLLITRFFERI